MLPGEHGVFLLLFVGVVTGVGGGVMRDILAGNIPKIFLKHVYALASLAGAAVCAGLWQVSQLWAFYGGAATVIIIRLLSAYFKWNMPRSAPFGENDK